MSVERGQIMSDLGDLPETSQPPGLQDTKTDRRRPGRLKFVNSNLIPLLRNSATLDVKARPDQLPLWDVEDEVDDSLNVMRGIAVGIALALPIWGMMIAAIYRWMW
jgi:hypothetical protein